MTYQTPELLLVGAAQNLVLGEFSKSDDTLNHDFAGPGYTNGPGYVPDSGSW